MINLEVIENTETPDNLESNIIDYGPSEPEYSEEELINDEPEEESTMLGIDRRRKILILQFYLNEFPQKLAVYRDFDFETLSDSDLERIREEFDFIIGTKNTVNISVRAFQHSIIMLEDFCTSFTPLKVHGLKNINQDPELMEDVKLLSLQNMALIKTKPEHRILFKVISTMGVLHNFNSSQENITQPETTNAQNRNEDFSQFDDL